MKNTIQLHTVSNIANGIIVNALESGRLLGVTWPVDKEFAVVMTHSTWPCGWSNQYMISFFDTEEEMTATFANTEEWALCEDNYFARRAYRWDWGPVEMPEHSHDAYRIPTKLNSYMSVSTGDDFGYDGYMRRAKEKDRRAELLKAATPKEFCATAYSMYEQGGLIPRDGQWPFCQLEKATSPLFISAKELKRIQDASKDVNMDEPPVISAAPDLSDDDGYW
jgi:hypothetical protein